MNRPRRPGRKITSAEITPEPQKSRVVQAVEVVETLDESETLSVSERADPAQHEAITARALKTFVEVGMALAAIRSGALYREHFRSFGDYCRTRWGLSRPYAYQLMQAARVVANVSAIADTAPATESQARPLAS